MTLAQNERSEQHGSEQHGSEQSGSEQHGSEQNGSKLSVQLWYAPLPAPLGWFARHYWFVLSAPEAAERWEVWQSRAAGGINWGYVHQNLMAPASGVGGGPARIETEWRGDLALALAEVLRSPLDYPHRERYRAWPGPNSNTYAAWVLRTAGVGFRLGLCAPGSRWTPKRW